MRVVVDLQACQSGSRFGGIGRFSMDLLRSMIAADSEAEFIILLNSLFPKAENDIRSSLRNMVRPDQFVTFPAPSGCASGSQNPALTCAAELMRENYISSLNPDVVHVASLVEGFHEDIVTSLGRSSSTPPTAVTFYDLIPLVEQEAYLASRITRAHYFEKIRSLSNADALLAISDFVAQEGIRLLPDFQGTMFTIKGGIGSQFRPLMPSRETARLRQKFGLHKPFILYVASFDQRKNQGSLIRAFAKLDGEVKGKVQLALAGGGSPAAYAQLRTVAEEHGLTKDEFVTLGRVSDEELVALYSCCSLFAFPPLSEGLGMPPLEAAACGAVVVASATSSIPEVVGHSDALFDPFNIDSIAEKLRLGLFDQSFRSESRRRAQDQIKKFSWTQSAQIALGALRSIVSARSDRPERRSLEAELRDNNRCQDLVDADLIEIASCSIAIEDSADRVWSRNAPRIAWVSSWDKRCGIADYSRHLVDHIEPKPLIFASYNEADVGAANQPNVIRCWEEGKRDYLVELSTSLFEAGIDIVHFQFNYGFFEFEAFRNLVVSLVSEGKSVFITLHSTTDQFAEPSWRLSWLADSLKLCHRIFVHSRFDVQRLADLNIVENVTLIPIASMELAAIARERRSPVRTIMTYGFALPGKGLPEAVEAVSILRSQGHDVSLKMLNAHYQDPGGISASIVEQIKEKIEKLNLSGCVQPCFDYLPEDECVRRMAEADILLFPYTKTGESGSAAVRAAMAVDRPVAVTPLPIFDDIREAAHVLPGTSASDIAVGLAPLLGDKSSSKHEDRERSLEGVMYFPRGRA